ncbi:hypothetical protein NSERUTF1_1727 [Nocardia seriolae]|nr:hypothetical protein NSERUTF1_1727 [Nocardia seriolae]
MRASRVRNRTWRSVRRPPVRWTPGDSRPERWRSGASRSAGPPPRSRGSRAASCSAGRPVSVPEAMADKASTAATVGSASVQRTAAMASSMSCPCQSGSAASRSMTGAATGRAASLLRTVVVSHFSKVESRCRAGRSRPGNAVSGRRSTMASRTLGSPSAATRERMARIAVCHRPSSDRSVKRSTRTALVSAGDHRCQRVSASIAAPATR